MNTSSKTLAEVVSMCVEASGQQQAAPGQATDVCDILVEDEAQPTQPQVASGSKPGSSTVSKVLRSLSFGKGRRKKAE